MEGDNLERIPLRENLTGQGLILVALALMALGVVVVFSTAGHTGGSDVAWYYRRDVRQAIFAALGALILCTLWRMDYHWLARPPRRLRRWLMWVPSPAAVLLIFALAAAAAVLVPGIGRAVGGYRRYIRFGPMGFQPSEVLKFAAVIYLAAWLGRPRARPRSFSRTFLPAVGLIGLAVGLVVTEDFGTAAIVGIAAGALLLMSGVRWYYVLGLVPLAAGGFYGFVVRSEYRWRRIEAMLDPFSTMNPAAYQPRQSMICIASGGSAPAGLGAGIAKHGYLPEISTDFVFSNICEEMGVLGAAAVIGLLGLWLWLLWRVAVKAPDRSGALLAGGLGFLISLQAAMHIAVAVVWMPPTGIGLPFVSAGGSSLIAMSVATALIVSVTARRQMLNAK